MRETMDFLLVEDDRELGKSLVESLRIHGYAVEHVLDGRTGLARATVGDHRALTRRTEYQTVLGIGAIEVDLLKRTVMRAEILIDLVESQISRLRTRLNDGFKINAVETVRGVGLSIECR